MGFSIRFAALVALSVTFATSTAPAHAPRNHLPRSCHRDRKTRCRRLPRVPAFIGRQADIWAVRLRISGPADIV